MRTSTRLDDTDSQTFYWLGRALMAQQKFSGAMAAFTTATDLNPQDAESFSNVGLVRMAQGHASDAATALTQAIPLKADYAEAHTVLNGFVLRKGIWTNSPTLPLKD